MVPATADPFCTFISAKSTKISAEIEEMVDGDCVIAAFTFPSHKLGEVWAIKAQKLIIIIITKITIIKAVKATHQSRHASI